MANLSVDATAFAVFDMQKLSADSLDAGLAAAGDELAAVFFRGSDCFNCEIAKKAMLAQPETLRAPGLRWLRRKVYEHCDLGRRFMLHGVPTRFFFYRGKRLGRATGWHGPGQFEGAVCAKVRALRPVVRRATREKAVKEAEKVRPIEKN
ncbi:thioredoxin [Paraburkholderia bryophila]|uniref:thioredoxin n=1 Tax=Paraburkholderia bryophila TaxID=420952 RepID=UPI00234AB9CB|nr:thioredoxin [Paraburkholderia bryophila]WCM20407.1 thioredoxin [Paraburkholderia bryophila]